LLKCSPKSKKLKKQADSEEEYAGLKVGKGRYGLLGILENIN